MAKTYSIENKVIYNPSLHTLHSKENNECITLAISSSLCFYVLLQNKGKIITQAELLQSVWGERGMNVTSSTLYQNISLLRKALNRLNVSDLAIQTIPKRGFMIANEIMVLEHNDEEEKKFNLEAPGAVTLPKDTNFNTDAEEMDCSSVDKNHNLMFFSWLSKSCRKIPVIDLIAIFVLVTLCFVQFFSRSPHNAIISSKYNELADMNGCTVLWDSDLTDDSYFSRFIKDKNITCSAGQTLYLTNYFPSSRTSLISCRNPIDSEKRPYCTSTYYLK